MLTVKRNHHIIVASDFENTVSLVKKAIADNVEWIRLDIGEIDKKDTERIVDEVITLCKKSNVILTFTDDVDLTDEKRVHGVHLTEYDEKTLRDTRIRLGANAIIGVTVDSLADIDLVINALRKMDIDYLSLNGDDYLIE